MNLSVRTLFLIVTAGTLVVTAGCLSDVAIWTDTPTPTTERTAVDTATPTPESTETSTVVTTVKPTATSTGKPSLTGTAILDHEESGVRVVVPRSQTDPAAIEIEADTFFVEDSPARAGEDVTIRGLDEQGSATVVLPYENGTESPTHVRVYLHDLPRSEGAWEPAPQTVYDPANETFSVTISEDAYVLVMNHTLWRRHRTAPEPTSTLEWTCGENCRKVNGTIVIGATETETED